MDVGLQTGGNQKILFQVQGLGKAQLAGLRNGFAEQSLQDRPHQGGRQPVGNAVQLALAGHSHLVEGIDEAKPRADHHNGTI